jgi:hypothetical protein
MDFDDVVTKVLDDLEKCKKELRKKMGNQITYKGNTVVLDEDPRTGICNFCRCVMGEVDAQRDKVFQREHNIHHEEYHDDDPLKDAIEAYVLHAIKE